jgi:hypothetical protein
VICNRAGRRVAAQRYVIGVTPKVHVSFRLHYRPSVQSIYRIHFIQPLQDPEVSEIRHSRRRTISNIRVSFCRSFVGQMYFGAPITTNPATADEVGRESQPRFLRESWRKVAKSALISLVSLNNLLKLDYEILVLRQTLILIGKRNFQNLGTQDVLLCFFCR